MWLARLGIIVMRAGHISHVRPFVTRIGLISRNLLRKHRKKLVRRLRIFILGGMPKTGIHRDWHRRCKNGPASLWALSENILTT